MPTNWFRKIPRLIPKENSFELSGINYIYLQTQSTTLGTKMAIVSTNIIMSKIENELTSASSIEPLPLAIL